MRFKLITAFIIAFNAFLLAQDIPLSVIVFTFLSVFLAIFLKNNQLKIFLKIALLLVSLFILRKEFKTLLVTDCAVSLVLILASLKFWELDKEKDHFNMFLILCLSECSLFLLNPTFLIFFLGIIKMFFYFYYILRIRNYTANILNYKRLFILITPSIFLSLILFYTFPRFTQGFLNTNDSQFLFSGTANNMDFTKLGPLTLSSEQAFRVYGLEKSNMPFSLLYWRTNVLWEFSGQEWRAGFSSLRAPLPIIENPKYKYDVELLQPIKDFLPTLDGQSSIIAVNAPYNYYSEGSFKLKTASRLDITSTVIGDYGGVQTYFSPLMRKKGLRLFSRETDLIRDTYNLNIPLPQSDKERLKILVDRFKKRGFEYSLNPPIYKSQEDFLINGIRGYCSHFAGAFAYLARTIGLPSRIVVGYLGGEYNPYNESVLIKELDAHAWSEVYIEGKGWVKVDPTALVAPSRLTMSAAEFNQALNPYITIFNFQISRDFFTFPAINNFSLWLDSLNSRFNTNIFNFDREKQLSILKKITSKNISIGWIFSFSLVLFMFALSVLFYFYGKSKVDHRLKRYLKFLNEMAKKGVLKMPHETAREFEKRCLLLFPQDKNHIEHEINLYIETFYK